VLYLFIDFAIYRFCYFWNNHSKKEMSNDCATVIDLWTHWGQTTTVDRNSPTACCSILEARVQRTGIEGVTCLSDGSVTHISWYSQSLSGSIPDSIGNLKNLEGL
jgi:hypothetical protein